MEAAREEARRVELEIVKIHQGLRWSNRWKRRKKDCAR
jgi:hypothetical protein